MFSFLKNAKKEGKGKFSPLLLLCLGVAGIILLLCSGNWFGEQDATDEAAAPTDTEVMLSYQKHLEDQVENICREVSGVGKVEAVVTLASGYTARYATEIRDGQVTYVLVGSGKEESGLHLSTLTPEILGIGVVCAGGDDPRIQQELTLLLSSAFGVPSSRIYITKSR